MDNRILAMLTLIKIRKIAEIRRISANDGLVAGIIGAFPLSHTTTTTGTATATQRGNTEFLWTELRNYGHHGWLTVSGIMHVSFP